MRATTARADEGHGPVEVRDLAMAFNALSARNLQLVEAQAEALRLQQEAFAVGREIRVASGIEEAMRATCGRLGPALGAGRAIAVAIDESRQITATAQWHRAGVADLPETVTDWSPLLWRAASELWASGSQLVVPDLLAEEIQEQGWPEAVHRETGATTLLVAFFRASNAAGMAIPGTGLGLVIVAAIVDADHGRLAVDSAESVGTTVTLRFPLATADVKA